MELEVAQLGRQMADAITAEILKSRVADPELQANCAQAVKTHSSLRSGGARKVQVTLLGGQQVVCQVEYYKPNRRTPKGRRRRTGRRGKGGAGLYPVLAALGIWFGVTPALAAEVCRQVADSDSVRSGRSALERHGADLGHKPTLRLVNRFSARAVEQRQQWLDKARKEAPKEGPLSGRRVVIATDGGRLRDLHGIATAWLLAGDLDQAEVYLSLAAPRSEDRGTGEAGVPASLYPDIDSDRAIIAMTRGHLDEALWLTDGVLRARPEHRPALWNRALVLGRLDLGLAGAAVFDGLKALGEAGWSVEAGQRAAYLRAPIEERRQRWGEVLKAGREMAAGGPILVDLVAKAPGYARLYLYDAVRAAPDAMRAWALLPFAEALDEFYGGDVLRRYVQKIAARPFARRAPLAKTYAQLVAKYDFLDAQGQDRYLSELRQTGEDDLILGALVVLDRVRDHLAEYRRLALASGDPWFVLIADTEEAKAETAKGEHRRAEERLLVALDTCQRQKMEYRCVWIENTLANVYRSMDLLAEAEAHAQAGRELAKKTGDWQTETAFLRNLSDIAQARNDASLDKALLDEIDWRDVI